MIDLDHYQNQIHLQFFLNIYINDCSFLTEIRGPAGNRNMVAPMVLRSSDTLPEQGDKSHCLQIQWGALGALCKLALCSCGPPVIIKNECL